MRRKIWSIALVAGLLIFCISCAGTLGIPKPTPTLSYEEVIAEYKKAVATADALIESLVLDVPKGEREDRGLLARLGYRSEIECQFCWVSGCYLDLRAKGYPVVITAEGSILVETVKTNIELSSARALYEAEQMALFSYLELNVPDNYPEIELDEFEVQVVWDESQLLWRWWIAETFGTIVQNGDFITVKDNRGEALCSFEWAICDDGSVGFRVVGEICSYCPEE